MAYLNIERVTALPQTLRASTLYIVRSAHAGMVEMYFTSTDGADVRHVINKDEIQSMINQYVVNATSGLSEIKIVASIADRNALNPTVNSLCLVLDATADSSVAAGAALYVYDAVGLSWSKVAEYESMDVQLLWGSIQGRPTSAVADIDDAVTKRHTHVNIVQLDKISEDGDGNLMYGGAYPKVPLDAEQW